MNKWTDVYVTEDNIAYGQQRDRMNCAIVEALGSISTNKNNGGWTRFWVDGDRLAFSVQKDDIRYEWEAPVNVAKAIRAFDAGEPVEPFNFSLDLAAATKRPIHHPTPHERRKKAARNRIPKKPGKPFSVRPKPQPLSPNIIEHDLP